jgi:hypothetical protein
MTGGLAAAEFKFSSQTALTAQLFPGPTGRLRYVFLRGTGVDTSDCATMSYISAFNYTFDPPSLTKY